MALYPDRRAVSQEQAATTGFRRRASDGGGNLRPMVRPAVRTRKGTIAEYWLGTPEGRARLPDNAALIDWGEPSCFACGWMAADRDAEPVLWRVWEEALLERCHLVPHALGGLDCADNLVLLCGRCHRDAPDVATPDYMLRWIGARESWGVAL